jgi:hypothetical protein
VNVAYFDFVSLVSYLQEVCVFVLGILFIVT